MELPVKKIYCKSCRRLVKGIEQKNNPAVNLNCSRCGTLLWQWHGIQWKPMN